MPSCVAWGCGARASKGVLFKVFPRKDLKRRKIWIERVNLPGWAPTRYSALCEKHFDHEQWELPREDGKRKLKETAVPTIFCVGRPSKDDIVAKDHSYCIVGYRQLYESSDTSNKISNDFIPFEHIKVEVDEDRNFALEEEQVEEAENIQCTPDIYEEPEENVEPDPIEMVHCETNEMNPKTVEPCIDPLAISQEDMRNAESVVPHFQHTKKFLFIPKGTTLVSPLSPPKVMGEPTVDIQQPKLKVLSPEQLLQPRTAPKMDSSLKQTVPNDKKCLKLDEKCLPFSRGQKVHVIIKKHSSDINNSNRNAQSHQFSKLTPPLLTRNVNFGVGGSSIRVKNPLTIPSPPPLIPSPEFLKTAKVVRVTPNLKNKFIKIGGTKHDMQMSPKSQIVLLKKHSKSNIKINSKVENGFLKKFKKNLHIKELNPISNSVEVCEKLEKIFLDHEYVGKPLWRPVSMDGMKMIKESSKSNRSVYRLIGNNDVKMWLTNNKISDKVNGNECLKTSTKFKITDPGIQTASDFKKIDSVCLSGSSVVVLNPFEKSRNATGDPSIQLISPSNRQKVNLFLCAICHCSFLTMATLKAHQSTHSVTAERSKRRSSSSSTDTAEEEENELVELNNSNKIDCKPSGKETETPIGLGPAKVNKNTDICNKMNTDISMKKLIPTNFKLKELTISIPKLKLIPEIESIKQKIDLKKDLPIERTLRSKSNNKKYSLRSKSKQIKTKFGNKSYQNKKQTLYNKTIISSISRLKMKENKNIVNKPLLNINSNVKTSKKLEDSTESSNKLGNKVTKTLKHTSCGVFVTKNKLNKEPKEPQNPSSNHLCNFCDKKFSRKFLLQRHIAEDHQHRKNKPYKCQWDMCNKMFTSKRQSENHSKICSKSSF